MRRWLSRTEMAWHEAGHAVMLHTLGYQFDRAYVRRIPPLRRTAKHGMITGQWYFERPFQGAAVALGGACGHAMHLSVDPWEILETGSSCNSDVVHALEILRVDWDREHLQFNADQAGPGGTCLNQAMQAAYEVLCSRRELLNKTAERIYAGKLTGKQFREEVAA